MLISNVNIIINAAGTSQLDTQLDTSIKKNVKAPLYLLDFAQQCHQLEAFCHVSSLYALADRTGFIDEKMYASNHDWPNEYQNICGMSQMAVQQE